MSGKKDQTISALEAVHDALKPLGTEERQRVLTSVCTLLGITEIPAVLQTTAPSVSSADSRQKNTTAAPVRPVAIRELIQEKDPGTHPEYITLFAYYREKHQNLPTFSRAALEEYYRTSRVAPPSNYDRDFVKAVERGWIHEDGDNSYITSKGLEAVESNFADTGEKTSIKKAKKPKKKSASKK